MIKFRAWSFTEKKMYSYAYQKLLSVMLSEKDLSDPENKNTPLKKSSYSDCDLMQSSGVYDKNGCEIYEGDIIRIQTESKQVVGVVDSIVDMHSSRGLHPFQDLLNEHEIIASKIQEYEVLGNTYEKPDMIGEKN